MLPNSRRCDTLWLDSLNHRRFLRSESTKSSRATSPLQEINGHANLSFPLYKYRGLAVWPCLFRAQGSIQKLPARFSEAVTQANLDLMCLNVADTDSALISRSSIKINS